MKGIFFIYLYSGKIIRRLGLIFDSICTRIMMADPKITIGSGMRSVGRPVIKLGRNSRLIIGDRFKMNHGIKTMWIGRGSRCTLNVGDSGQLLIGHNVGMSSTAIVANNKVQLGDNIRIGTDAVIWDTDFHSLVPEERLSKKDPGIRMAPVIIEDNVFIGASAIILRGVVIGRNSIVGAGSVVTKSIPPNEIWAGNPAKFIRKLKI